MSAEMPEDIGSNVRDGDPVSAAGARWGVLRFVVTFVALVMALLIGYRYAMDSRANIWYLYQVASHTSWTLGLVAGESEVEPFRGFGVAGKRRQMAEWAAIDAGAESLPAAADRDDTPFTPYESWRYEAKSRIRNGGTLQEHGPTVRVVIDQGLDARSAEIRLAIKELQSASSPGQDASAVRIAALESELATVQAKLLQIPDGPERDQARRGRQFAFRVVPDCGAVPSMSIFLAAVLAFPTLWWKRGVGAAGGLSILYFINILRLATLGYVGAVDLSPGRKWFSFIHEYVWQGVFIVFVVVVWMLWVEFVVRARRV